MSSILKALRKLEDEKGDMGEGNVDLARDILKRSYEEHRSNPILTIVAVASICILLLVVGWWALSYDAADDVAGVMEPAPVQTSVSPPLVSVENAVLLESGRQPVVLLPTAATETEMNLKVKQQPVAVEVKKTKSPVKVVTVPPILIPDLTIEEIVYNEDPSNRLAVINDLPVMQGTDIDGARVLEILPDRVRFEFQGVHFDKFKTVQKE